jgi:hypothetical protein
LRFILHVDDNGVARILSQVFLGQLNQVGNHVGICTSESHLLASAKTKATRIVCAHMPLDRVIAATGTVGNASTLELTIDIPFNDPTNPFVHKYHPDHDNKTAKGAALSAGQESYNISREIKFSFTANPPTDGESSSGWGSSVIGGNYTETIQGLSKDTKGVGNGDGIHLRGTFELRRVSEIGILTDSN